MRVLTLPARLNREASNHVAAELRTWLDDTGPIMLDASGVDQVATAGLQLLLSATTPGATGAPPVRLDRPSPALVEAARLAGIADRLGIVHEGAGDDA